MNLDDALQAWATERVALPAPVADDIFREIGASPAGLDASRWNRFSGQLVTTVVASTLPRVPVLGP